MIIDGQTDFSGGMNELDTVQPNQFVYAENMEFRDGKARTRRAVRQAVPRSVEGLAVGFYFNEDNARYNDETHDGFWFPFSFVAQTWGLDIQGAAVVKKDSWHEERLLYVSAQVCLMLNGVLAETVSVADPIQDGESVHFEQAANKVYMFRADHDPLVWDFGSGGFVALPDPSVAIEARTVYYPPTFDDYWLLKPGASDTPDAYSIETTYAVGDLCTYNSEVYECIKVNPDTVAATYWDGAPQGDGAVYFLGRLWAWWNDYVAASDILAFADWDQTQRKYAVGYGDGDDIVCLYPFSDDFLLVCKSRKISALNRCAGFTLDEISRVDVADTGPVGPNALARVGEDVWYLSRQGVFAVHRNQYNYLESAGVALSYSVSRTFGRINWAAAEKICGGCYDNFVFFGIPIDGATRNNAVLVFDRVVGGWCGLWTGRAINPARFLNLNGVWCYLSEDGFVRSMFSDDHYDTANYVDEILDFSEVLEYEPGDLVRSDGRYWQCERANPKVVSEHHAPPRYYEPEVNAYWREWGRVDTASAYQEYQTYMPGDVVRLTRSYHWAYAICRKQTPDKVVLAVVRPENDTDGYWSELSNPLAQYAIRSQIVTRDYRFNSEQHRLAFARGEIIFEHQNPAMQVEMAGPDPFDAHEVFDAPITYDQTRYDVAGVDDWDPTNVNLDYGTPNRQDYTLLMPAAGMYMSDAGIRIGGYETHSARFLKQMANGQAVRLKITNSRGRIGIRSIALTAMNTVFAGRNR
ncbi:MAG: hypothetical protein EOM20_03305 [Spartobacteria bacterium]|nr:hypothetical protein [Spartobacteria bacterium]